MTELWLYSLYPIKVWCILHQPALLSLCNIPYESLVPGLHKLMKDNPIRLSIEHQRARVSMKDGPSGYIPKRPIRLHLRCMGKKPSRQTPTDLLAFVGSSERQGLFVGVGRERLVYVEAESLQVPLQLGSDAHSLG